MTHPDTAEMINRQIAIEFDKLNDFMTFEHDKPAILNRINELKSMLDEHEVQEPMQLSGPEQLFVDYFRNRARRRANATQ
jgi:hypothetical protein